MWAKISAVYIENGKPQRDHMVIVVPVNPDHTVAAGECFGKVVDDKKTYPFTGTAKGTDFVLDYGALCDSESTRIGIVGRHLRVSQLFVRTDIPGGRARRREYNYRVESISPAVIGANPPESRAHERVSERDVAIGMTLNEVIAAVGKENLGQWAPFALSPDPRVRTLNTGHDTKFCVLRFDDQERLISIGNVYTD